MGSTVRVATERLYLFGEKSTVDTTWGLKQLFWMLKTKTHRRKTVNYSEGGKLGSDE